MRCRHSQARYVLHSSSQNGVRSLPDIWEAPYPLHRYLLITTIKKNKKKKKKKVKAKKIGQNGFVRVRITILYKSSKESNYRNKTLRISDERLQVERDEQLQTP